MEKNTEDVENKTPDFSGFVTADIFDTKFGAFENKIPDTSRGEFRGGDLVTVLVSCMILHFRPKVGKRAVIHLLQNSKFATIFEYPDNFYT